MIVYVNNKSIKFSKNNIIVDDILNKLNLKKKNVVVLKNGIIIDNKYKLKDKDKLDIVSFIGGG